ncbi:isoprenylcysteine carboxylmethyltransferase family protein [Virgibacillus oceani]
MAILMYFTFLFILSVRVLELYISKRNEQWFKERRAVEKERRKYKWLRLLHQLFFLSILFEWLFLINPGTFNVFFLFLFILVSAGKLWCVLSLGRFWTLRKFMLPGVLLFKRGPYRFIKEPYNVINFIQLFIVPLIFGAYVTALIFPLFQLLLMQLKMPERGGLFEKASL